MEELEDLSKELKDMSDHSQELFSSQGMGYLMGNPCFESYLSPGGTSYVLKWEMK